MLEINFWWLFIGVVIIAFLFLCKELIYKALRNKIEAEISENNTKKDIRNIEEWSKTANNIIVLEACQDPNVEANFQRLQTYLNEHVACEIDLLKNKHGVSDELSKKIDTLMDMMKKIQKK